jgi:hypothetical protein
MSVMYDVADLVYSKRTRVEGRVQDGAVDSELECFEVS